MKPANQANEVSLLWLEDKDWMSTLSHSLFNMYQAKALCDTTLISSDGISLPCHALVLAAATPYLCSLLKAATQNFRRVNIKVSISSAILRQVVDFVYLGRLAVDPVHLTELAAAADQLDIEGLKSACAQWGSPGVTNTTPAKLLKPESSDTKVQPESANEVDAVPEEVEKQHDQPGTVLPPSDQNDGNLASSTSDSLAVEEPTVQVLSGAAKKVKPSASDGSVSGPTFYCTVCNRQFGQMSHLQQHMRLHTGEKPYSCKYCDKRFNVSSNLNRHLKIHTGERPYVCKICLRAFNQSSHLKQHERGHSGHKPFQCNLCKRQFAKTSHVKRHMMVHLGQKMFKCSECPKAFTDSSHLREHSMTHTGQRPHVCVYCKKAFTFKRSMIQHMRLHTGEKPYTCDLCDKRFARFQQLREHKLIHTGQRVHECNECGAAFFFKAEFQRHLQMHKAEKLKRFQCSVCDKIYSRQRALDQHYLKMHANVPELSMHDQESSNIPRVLKENDTGSEKQALVKMELEDYDVSGAPSVASPKNLTESAGGQDFVGVEHAVEGSAPVEDEGGLVAIPSTEQVLVQGDIQQQIEQTLQQAGYLDTMVAGDGASQEIQVLVVEDGFEFVDSGNGEIVLQGSTADM